MGRRGVVMKVCSRSGVQLWPAMALKALKMTDRLEAELPHMLAEHKDIVTALQGLVEAAKAENKPEYVHFAEKLMACPH